MKAANPGVRMGLAAVGAALLGAGALLRGRVALATILMATGCVAIFVGLLLPWIETLEVGPAKIKLRDREATASIAAEEPESVGDAESLEGDGEGDGEALDEQGRILGALRFLTAQTALDAILNPRTGPLAGYVFHLYLLDAEQEVLVSAFEPAGAVRPEDWPVGTGATGHAWQLGQYILATDDAAWDQTYGLTLAQQERYRDRTAVAAMPVTNWGLEVIGVITASSREPDSALVTPDGFDQHLLIARQVGRILIDLLKWFPDQREAGGGT